MSDARNTTVRGIIVGRSPVAEGSARILLYTDAFGLIRAGARSLREERSQLRAHAQEGTLGRFTIVSGRDVWRLTGAVETKNFYLLSNGGARAESGARVIALMRQFIHGEGSDPYLFECLYNFFDSLPERGESYLHEAECLVVLRMLAALGYVRADDVSLFLDHGYDEPILKKTVASKSSLIRLINEGIRASDLS